MSKVSQVELVSACSELLLQLHQGSRIAHDAEK